jgi:hypothetical protein
LLAHELRLEKNKKQSLTDAATVNLAHTPSSSAVSSKSDGESLRFLLARVMLLLVILKEEKVLTVVEEMEEVVHAQDVGSWRQRCYLSDLQ